MKTVLILGASGNFGSHAAQAFAQAGWQVRRYQRGTDIIAAAQDVQVVVNAMNPPAYQNWAVNQPKIAALGLQAARVADATLIVPGNVYNFGSAPAPWGPDTPQNPQTRKGKIRVAMEQQLRAATDVRVIVLRGGDYLNPNSAQTGFGMVTAKAISKGVITAMGAMDVPHSFAYLPDMARAAVGLAQVRDRLPRFADIPFAGTTLTLAQAVAQYREILDRPITVKKFPWWVMRVLAPFWGLARELMEMRYLNDHPHWMEGETLHRYVPDFQPTPLDMILRNATPDLVQAQVQPDQTMRALNASNGG